MQWSLSCVWSVWDLSCHQLNLLVKCCKPDRSDGASPIMLLLLHLDSCSAKEASIRTSPLAVMSNGGRMHEECWAAWMASTGVSREPSPLQCLPHLLCGRCLLAAVCLATEFISAPMCVVKIELDAAGKCTVKTWCCSKIPFFVGHLMTIAQHCCSKCPWQ